MVGHRNRAPRVTTTAAMATADDSDGVHGLVFASEMPH